MAARHVPAIRAISRRLSLVERCVLEAQARAARLVGVEPGEAGRSASPERFRMRVDDHLRHDHYREPMVEPSRRVPPYRYRVVKVEDTNHRHFLPRSAGGYDAVASFSRRRRG